MGVFVCVFGVLWLCGFRVLFLCCYQLFQVVSVCVSLFYYCSSFSKLFRLFQVLSCSVSFFGLCNLCKTF